MPRTHASSNARSAGPKTARKSATTGWTKFAPPPRRGGPRLPLGAHPGNTGGKKGRSGRPPAAFKQFARALYDDPEVQAQITRVLRNHREKHFAAVLKALLPIVAASEDASLLADASKRTGLRIEIVPAREPASENLVHTVTHYTEE